VGSIQTRQGLVSSVLRLPPRGEAANWGGDVRFIRVWLVRFRTEHAPNVWRKALTERVGLGLEWLVGCPMSLGQHRRWISDSEVPNLILRVSDMNVFGTNVCHVYVYCFFIKSTQLKGDTRSTPARSATVKSDT
jgi:hypothetical protein